MASTGVPDHLDKMNFFKLPPAYALAMAPLAKLPRELYAYIWFVMLVGSAVLCLLLALRMLYGRWLPADPWQMGLPALILLPFVWDDLHCGNNNLIVLAPLMGGAFLAARGWSTGGSVRRPCGARSCSRATGSVARSVTRRRSTPIG